jgi:hypothetical protein
VRETERLAHIKVGYLVACRLGDPTFPHIIGISRCRYDNRDGEMMLTEQLVEIVEELQSGPDQLVRRLLDIKPKAEKLAQEGLGNFHIVIDITRSHEIWPHILSLIQVGVFLIVTTHGRLHADTPYWLAGRTTLLSFLATAIAKNVITFAKMPDDPRFLTADRLRDALNEARKPPPKLSDDEYLTNTTTNDDIALVLGISALYAEHLRPDPWLDLEKRPVRFAL